MTLTEDNVLTESFALQTIAFKIDGQFQWLFCKKDLLTRTEGYFRTACPLSKIPSQFSKKSSQKLQSLILQMPSL